MDKQFDAENFMREGLAWSYKQDKMKQLIMYNRALRTQPNNATLYSFLGYNYFHQKDFNRAVSNQKKSIIIDPLNVQEYRLLAITLFHQMKYDEAISQYKKIIDIDPKSSEEYSEWGWVLYHQEKYEEAIEKFEKAIECNDGNISQFFHYGLVLFHQGKFDETVRLFKSGLEIVSNMNKRKFRETIVKYQNEIEFTYKQLGTSIDEARQNYFKSKLEGIKLFFGVLKHFYKHLFREFQFNIQDIDTSSIVYYLTNKIGPEHAENLIIFDFTLTEYYHFFIQEMNLIVSKIYEALPEGSDKIISAIAACRSPDQDSNLNMVKGGEQLKSQFLTEYKIDLGEIYEIILIIAKKLAFLRKDYLLEIRKQKSALKNMPKFQNVRNLVKIKIVETKVEECAVLDMSLFATALFLEIPEIDHKSNINPKMQNIAEKIFFKMKAINNRK